MGCSYSKTESNEQPKKAKKSSAIPIEHAENPQSSTPTQKNEISITLDESEQDSDVKILLLGSGESGKSTIWRQLKLIYCGGFSQDEREDMTRVVRMNLIYDIKQLVEAVQSSDQSLPEELENYIEDITNLATEEDFTKQTARETKAVWDDPTLKMTYKQNNLIGGDNFSFFLDSAERIAEQNYIPTGEDILKSRIRTTGLSILQFKIDNKIRTQLADAPKIERSKWSKYYKGFQYVIFVISLSDFDQYMYDDEKIKRTQDSLDLFETVANSEVFSTKPIFLVFNKKDVFEHKLREFPDKFRETYPEFKGNINNIDECIDHVKERFMSQLTDRDKEKAWVESISSCAMDTNNVRNLFQIISKKLLSSEKLKI